ncbi:MAG: xanthine dehydrogenase family protein subunit M, partial [Deltaproteobacteria bacterium]|nr:xanthine dehydrogenase family protein subunit M [Deltaproteobacteria bacterium]
MRDFAHYNARSVEEAIGFLGKARGTARLNAGGTDLLGLLADEVLPRYPASLVNLKTIPGLDSIELVGGALRIGALTRLSALQASPDVAREFPVLAEAARSVASPQIRNMGTLGGNLCQDTRCWYYRYPSSVGGALQCARKGKGPCLAVKGDNRYHALLDARKCFAVCPSDTAVALSALDARLLIVGPRGERTLPVADFYHPLGNALEPDELVREVEIPPRAAPGQQTFLKFTLRKPIDFAVVSVASVLTVKEGRCTDARLVLGAVAPGPYRAEAAEKALVGRPLDEGAASEAAEAALAAAKPLSRNG